MRVSQGECTCTVSPCVTLFFLVLPVCFRARERGIPTRARIPVKCIPTRALKCGVSPGAVVFRLRGGPRRRETGREDRGGEGGGGCLAHAETAHVVEGCAREDAGQRVCCRGLQSVRSMFATANPVYSSTRHVQSGVLFQLQIRYMARLRACAVVAVIR